MLFLLCLSDFAFVGFGRFLCRGVAWLGLAVLAVFSPRLALASPPRPSFFISPRPPLLVCLHLRVLTRTYSFVESPRVSLSHSGFSSRPDHPFYLPLSRPALSVLILVNMQDADNNEEPVFNQQEVAALRADYARLQQDAHAEVNNLRAQLAAAVTECISVTGLLFVLSNVFACGKWFIFRFHVLSWVAVWLACACV